MKLGAPEGAEVSLRNPEAAAAQSEPQTPPQAIMQDADNIADTTLDIRLRRGGIGYIEDFLPLFGLPFAPIAESLGRKDAHVALRHDVHSVESALVGATLEQQLGIRGTYFLRHPDGSSLTSNYFGTVADGRLTIHEELFAWAKRLRDLDHEVALLNDLVTLGLATRRQPEEFLAHILNEFEKRNLKIVGTAGHDGSTLGRKLGYRNHHIFENFRNERPFADNRNQPLADAVRGWVTAKLYLAKMHRVRQSDYGLRYEANFVPSEVRVREDDGIWSITRGTERRSFEPADSARTVPIALGEALRQKGPRAAVRCEVQFCGWNAVRQLQPELHKALKEERDRKFIKRRKENMLERVAAFENIIAQRESDDRFTFFDQAYSAKSQYYKPSKMVVSFIEKTLRNRQAPIRSIIEVGCGQGELLAATRQMASTLYPGSAPLGLGIDASLAAILVSAGRYPEIDWIADELVRFLGDHDTLVPSMDGQPRRYDLVIDKSGSGFLRSYEEGRAYFAGITAVMQPGALYLYIIARDQYNRALGMRFRDWPKPWIGLAEEFFEPIAIADDGFSGNRGYLQRVFRRR